MADILVWMEQTPISVWVRDSGSVWAYPTVLFLHTAGLGLLVGMNTVVDARILGVASELPLAPLESLFPFMWAGFWINAISGIVLLMAAATTKLINPLFYIKMAFIATAVVLLIKLKKQAFGSVVQPAARWLAIGSLACWTGAIAAGRLLAYIGPGSQP